MAISSFLQPTELLTLDAIREKLKMDRTYYVDDGLGDDGNDGLTAGAGAFKTIEQAFFIVQNRVDFNGWNVTIQVADGTYSDPQPNDSFTSWIFASSFTGEPGNGELLLRGNPGTPANVIVEIGQWNGFLFSDENPVYIRIEGFRFTRKAGASDIFSCITAGDYSSVGVGSCIFDELPSATCLSAFRYGQISETAANEVTMDVGTGTYYNYGQAVINSTLGVLGSITVQTGTTADFTLFIEGRTGGKVTAFSGQNATGGGSISGKEFEMTENSCLFLGAAETIDGTTPGTYDDTSCRNINFVVTHGLEINGKLGGGGGGRELLTADRDYYVDPTLGNDANDGLSAGAGAFATIQKAVDVASLDLDLQRYKAVINLADDTYSEPRVQLRGLVGEKNAIDLMGVIHIKGNETTPTNVIVQNGMIAESPDAWYMVSGIYFHNTSGNHTCLKAEDGGMIGYASVNFGDAGAFGIHMWTQNHGTIMPCGGSGVPYAISGSAGSHMYAYKDSYCSAAEAEITFSGTPTFGSFGFLRAIDLGKIDFRVFSLLGTPGAVVGRRFYMEFNSQIATYFEIDGIPGDSTGFMHNSCWMGNYSLFTGTNIETLTANRAISEVIDCRTQVYLNTTSTLDVSLPDGGTVLFDYLREYVIVNRPTSTFPLLLKDDGGTLLATIAPGFQAAAVYDPAGDVWITI